MGTITRRFRGGSGSHAKRNFLWASLWDDNWNPLPPGVVCITLLHDEWWTTWWGRTDAGGRVQIPAFDGDYTITAGVESRDVSFRKEEGRVVVRFVGAE